MFPVLIKCILLEFVEKESCLFDRCAMQMYRGVEVDIPNILKYVSLWTSINKVMN
jgi:hypothetical protein